MTHPSRYDPLSPSSWDIDGHGTVYVGDKFFDDHERVLAMYYLDAIELEPISIDPDETKVEPIFYLSNKEDSKELTEEELIPYFIWNRVKGD